jgi:hypothetical protein
MRAHYQILTGRTRHRSDRPIAAKSQAITAITVTTLDPAISRTLGPRAAALLRRLRTIRTLAGAGIPVGLRIAPIISFVTKPEIERMRGDGVWADFIRPRFPKTVDRLGMNLRDGRFKTLDASCFRRPLFIPPPPSKQCNITTGRLDLF